MENITTNNTTCGITVDAIVTPDDEKKAVKYGVSIDQIARLNRLSVDLDSCAKAVDVAAHAVDTAKEASVNARMTHHKIIRELNAVRESAGENPTDAESQTIDILSARLSESSTAVEKADEELRIAEMELASEKERAKKACEKYNGESYAARIYFINKNGFSTWLDMPSYYGASISRTKAGDDFTYLVCYSRRSLQLSAFTVADDKKDVLKAALNAISKNARKDFAKDFDAKIKNTVDFDTEIPEYFTNENSSSNSAIARQMNYILCLFMGDIAPDVYKPVARVFIHGCAQVRTTLDVRQWNNIQMLDAIGSAAWHIHKKEEFSWNANESEKKKA